MNSSENVKKMLKSANLPKIPKIEHCKNNTMTISNSPFLSSNLLKNSTSVQKENKRYKLPIVTSITAKDPRKEMVASLNIEMEAYESFKRLYHLKNKREKVDISEDIASKRLNLHLGEDVHEYKKESLEKIKAKENELKGEQKLKEKIGEFLIKKKEYDSVIKNINDLYQKIKDLEITKESVTVENEEKASKGLIDNLKQNQYKRPPKKSLKMDKIDLFNRQNQMAILNRVVTEKRKRLDEQIVETKNKIEELKKELPRIHDEFENDKTQIKIARQELSDYYHLMLYEGMDFRNEGLITIIKKIWTLGENVDLSFMPSYLDNESIDYLFTGARQSLQLNELRQSLAEAKGNISLKYQDEIEIALKHNLLDILKEDPSMAKNDEIFRSTRVKEIEEEQKKTHIRNQTLSSNQSNISKDRMMTDNFLEKIKRKKERDAQGITFKKVKKKLKTAKHSFDVVLNDYKDIKKLEDLIKKMEEKVAEMKKKEIERLCKEFISNNYGEKYKVSFETVASALCGEESSEALMIYYDRNKKTYLDNLKKVKFYGTYDNTKSFPKSISNGIWKVI